MEWYRVIKEIEGLDRYPVGSRVPLYTGNRGQLLYHLWKTIIEIDPSYVQIVEGTNHPAPNAYK